MIFNYFQVYISVVLSILTWFAPMATIHVQNFFDLPKLKLCIH